MSTDPENNALASLVKIRDEAAAELAKAKKELERAKTKVARAEVSLSTLTDAVMRISGASETPKSQKDAILDVITAHGEDGVTTGEILEELALSGLAMDSKNPHASIQVAADRLATAGLIEIVATPSGKLFKRKA